MSKLLRLVNTLTTFRNGSKKQLGKVEEPFEMAMNNAISERTIELAASGTDTLFDGSLADAPFATASVIWVRSNKDCMVELTFDTAGVNGIEVMTLAIKGGYDGEMGAPLSIADARAYSNYTAGFAAGTIIYCDKVMIENLDTSDTATIEFFIGD